MAKIKVLRGNTSSLANYAGQSGEIALNYETGNLVFWTNTANVFYTFAGVPAGPAGPDWSSTTESIITASDAQVLDFFGNSISINSDATYVIVGSYKEDGGAGDPTSDAGAVYVYVRSDSTWSQQAILRASDAQASDQFGESVSISGDGSYAIVGAYGEDTGGSNAGAAYIFTRSGSTWTEQQKIQSSDIQATDYFGYSVAMSSDGSYAIVGTPYEDGGVGDPIGGAGAAYIFTRSGSTWTQQAKIQSSDAELNDYFGFDASISGDGTYAIVGAYNKAGGGAVYVFSRSGSTWTQQQKITASDAQASDQFGWSVSISGDGSYAIVGATGEDGGAGDTLANAGAAYVFSRSGSTWTQQAKLVPDDLQFIDNFGYSVSISGDGNTAIVGAAGEDGGVGNPLTDAGAVYVFTRSGSTWTQQAKLTASDTQAGDRFGISATINSDGSYAAVGAWWAYVGAAEKAGAAYIYKAS